MMNPYHPGFIATLTDHLLGLHPSAMVDCGVNSFNGSLLGTVLPALFHLVSDNEVHLWVAVCLGAFARSDRFFKAYLVSIYLYLVSCQF